MNAPMTNLVEQTLLERMQAKASFTALDISNALKAEEYPVRHGQVAAAVRNIFQSGAMGHYDYDRRLIDVMTDSGATKTQAFLYLHRETREREYTTRSQQSLPPVPNDQARDLSDSVVASPLPLLPRLTNRQRRAKKPCAGQGRRDGALAVPHALVERLGWTEGVSLGLQCESGQMRSRPPPPNAGGGRELGARLGQPASARLQDQAATGGAHGGAGAIVEIRRAWKLKNRRKKGDSDHV